jgi:hypothetical protein
MPNRAIEHHQEVSQVNEAAIAETHYASKIDFLTKRLHFHIDEYKEKRKQSRKHANAFKFGTIVLGALTLLIHPNCGVERRV